METEFIVTLLVLSILGIFTAGIITTKRLKKKPLVCPIEGDCEKVVSSKWSKIFFIKNDILGIAYYIFVLIFALYTFFTSNPIPIIVKIISITAFIFTIFLVFVQAKIIKQYCFYCLISALINFLIFINFLIL